MRFCNLWFFWVIFVGNNFFWFQCVSKIKKSVTCQIVFTPKRAYSSAINNLIFLNFHLVQAFGNPSVHVVFLLLLVHPLLCPSIFDIFPLDCESFSILFAYWIIYTISVIFVCSPTLLHSLYGMPHPITSFILSWLFFPVSFSLLLPLVPHLIFTKNRFLLVYTIFFFVIFLLFHFFRFCSSL